MTQKQKKQGNNNLDPGCQGCIILLVIPLSIWISSQVYFFQNTGKLNINFPKIQFGRAKTVDLCSESLKNTTYARNVSINKDGVVEFYVDYNFTLENGPSTYNIEWGKQGDVMWSWVNSYVSSDVMARCKGPVNIEYTYMYVKKVYRNSLVIPEPQK